ncbi:hypothetical protein CLOM_g22155 [Closterium sp. NIES-68]|nr:hypothetical protein CLOM_g22155 [Closterium sp. NIES-68]
MKRTNTKFLALATNVERDEEKTSEPPREIKEILKEFQDILPDDLPNELPPYRTHQHEIVEEPGLKPTFSAPYRLSPTELADLKKEIEYILAKGLIRPSILPYGAPVFFTPKPDGSLRMCIDYRALNKQTIKNKYPIPRIDDLLDQLRGATVFSKLDLRCGYWMANFDNAEEILKEFQDILPDDLPDELPPYRKHQHEIVEEPGSKPTFKAPYRLSPTEIADLKKQIQYLVAKGLIRPSTSPYGAPVLFTTKPDGSLRMCIDYRALKKQTIKNKYPIPRIDNLLDQLRGATVFSKLDLDESYPTPTLGRMREHFYVKLSKSDFALEKVQILGHIVSAQGVHVDPEKIEAVRMWKTPKNVKELQQFLGFANYYNRFVPQYAKIAAPLTNLLKNNTPYKWEPQHQEGMEQMKQALTSARVLNLRDPERDYVIEADTSDQAVGAVLMQDQGNGLQPIAYLSKILHGAELNYPIHDKEALAIIIAFKTWRCYLKGRKTTVYNDHCSLKYLKTQPSLSRRQVRWIDFLETHFHYNIVYKPSHKNKANALSWPAHCNVNPLLVPEQPWQVVSLDFITGLPTTTSGHDAILVVINKFSKMGHFIPTHSTARTKEMAQLFVRYIISQHDIPTTLISDRDPKFTSKFWKELMSLLGTKLAMSSAYHSQTDGQTKRLNQIVEQLLRGACKDDISKWDLHLPILEFAYNNATHTATGQTPFFLCYGHHPLTPQQPNIPATMEE